MRKPRVLLVVLMAAAMVVPSGGSASAGKHFTFYGSAWGHGIGLSQYGAYGLAQKGWSYRHILTHFYSHTRVGRAERVPRKIRVGLVHGPHRIHVSALGGPVALRVGSVKGKLAGKVPAGYTWTVTVREHRYKILDGKGRLVGGHLWGGPSRHLYALYRFSGATAFIPEAHHRYRRGWIEFNLYGTRRLRLIAILSPQAYLYGVAEVPSSWPITALRTQAVAARTYAFEKIFRLGQHRSGCNCGLYASTLDQVYVGWDKEIAADGGRWVWAVNHTARRVVKYHGHVIQAFYHSSSGGYTENNENVWGGSPIPYLRGVCDPGDFTAANPNRLWEVTFSGAGIGDRITRYTGKNIGDARRFDVGSRGVSGRIVVVTVIGTNGSVTLSGTTLRAALGLRDSKVWINTNRNVTWPMRAKYDALRCRPGLATTPKVKVPGGSRQRFQRGALFRNADRRETHWLHGRVYVFFQARGGVTNFGLPLTDVRRRSNGTLWAAFQHGRIVCRPGRPCRKA